MATWFTALDLKLNQSYFWVTGNLGKLLKDDEELKDFPVPFEPIVPDLYPSTIGDLEWQDMIAPDAERFLSTVQRYVHSKGIHDLVEKSPAWILVEFFRPSINAALERAAAYHQRMRDHQRQLLDPRKSPAAASPANKKPVSKKRFRIALSFPGERRSFVEQVAVHLETVIGRAQLLYDKYHESEFARVDLDTYLQKLYHDESELIAIFLCAHYERKEWCGLEWRSLRDLIKQRSGEAIMPLRFDNTSVSGLFSIDGYIEIGNRLPKEIAECILDRARLNGAL